MPFEEKKGKKKSENQ